MTLFTPKQTEIVRATVISQSRQGARALAKEWECSSQNRKRRHATTTLGTNLDEGSTVRRRRSTQRGFIFNLELLAIHVCLMGRVGRFPFPRNQAWKRTIEPSVGCGA